MFKNYLRKIKGKVKRFLKSKLKKSLNSKKFRENADDRWNNLFKGKNYFEYTFNKKSKINLYRDSKLSRLIYDGFEVEERKFVASILKEGDIFLDIGANVGLFTLTASTIVGSKGKVISFEPSPVIFKRLLENIRNNNMVNVECRNVGLSNNIENLDFYISVKGYDAWNSFAPSLDDKLEEKVTVPVSTLDKELNFIDKKLVKLVKIDVEGWEKFVLLGGEKFFKEFNPSVMVEFTGQNTINAGYQVQEIYDLLLSWGYTWYYIEDGKLKPEEKRENYPYLNLIAVKD